MHGALVNTGLAGFQEAKKNPHDGGFYLTVEGLTGVHAPPEDVAEDDDLLVLHFLEGVVLIRMLITVEAAQADAGGQAIKLLHPQLAVVIDGVEAVSYTHLTLPTSDLV